jgi:hypothetical protein
VSLDTTLFGQIISQQQSEPLKRHAKRGEATAFVEMAFVHEGDACLMWPFGCGGSGYPHYSRGDVHVVLCEYQHGPRPSARHEAGHSCGKKRCINRYHISWLTYEQNGADRVRHGTSNRGERQGAHKLTEANVLAIRASTETGAILGARFGVSGSHVSRIRRREEWAWL